MKLQNTWLTVCVCVYFQQLEESLVAFGEKWELNPQDGAFYGPKVGLLSSQYREQWSDGLSSGASVYLMHTRPEIDPSQWARGFFYKYFWCRNKHNKNVLSALFID